MKIGLQREVALLAVCCIWAAPETVSKPARPKLFIGGAVIAGMGQGISFRAGMGAIAAASPAREKAAVQVHIFKNCVPFRHTD